MTRSEILGVFRANLSTVVEGARDVEVAEDASMADYGADSMQIVEAVSLTIDQLGVRVPRAELSKIDTVGDLITVLAKARARS